MELSVNHLINRNGIYYFRCRFPQKNLEIKISLRTSDIKKAVAVSKLASEKLKFLIDSGVATMITISDIRQRITTYIKNALEEQERHFAEFGIVCDGTRTDARNAMLALSSKAEEALQNNDLQQPWARDTAHDLLNDLNPNESDLNIASREIMRAILYLSRVQRERMEGMRFSSDFSEYDFQTVLSGNYPKAQDIIIAEHADVIGGLTKQYLEAPVQRCVKGATDIKNTLELLCEYYGNDMDIRKLTKREMRNFRDNVLMKLPARRNILPKLKGMTLQEHLACQGVHRLSYQTINHRLADLSVFFSWCVEGEYIAVNPISGLQLQIDEKVNNERLPYSTEELNKIFYLLREDKLNAWVPFKLWIPLIMLYCGSRQNEVCQLFTNNIFLHKGVPCFSIEECEETGARVKNKSSIRIVPIHPVLLGLGFLGYVENRKSTYREDVQLWPQLEYSPAEGYARKCRKFFDTFNRKYITDNPKKTCYSLRHNFIDNLKQQIVDENLVAEIAGHTTDKITYTRYGKSYNPSIMLETMLKLDYGFDIFEVLGKSPISDEILAKQIQQLPSK